MRLEIDDVRWLVVHPGGDEDALAIRDSRHLLEGDAIAEDVLVATVDGIDHASLDAASENQIVDLRGGTVRLSRTLRPRRSPSPHP